MQFEASMLDSHDKKNLSDTKIIQRDEKNSDDHPFKGKDGRLIYPTGHLPVGSNRSLIGSFNMSGQAISDFKAQAKMIAKIFNDKEYFCLQGCPEDKDGYIDQTFLKILQEELQKTYNKKFLFKTEKGRGQVSKKKCIFYREDLFTEVTSSSGFNNAVTDCLPRVLSDDILTCLLKKKNSSEEIGVINYYGTVDPDFNRLTFMRELHNKVLSTGLCDTCVLVGDFNTRVLSFLPTRVHTYPASPPVFYSSDAIYQATRSLPFARINQTIYDLEGNKISIPARREIKEAEIVYDTYLSHTLQGDRDLIPETLVSLESNFKKFMTMIEDESGVAINFQMSVAPLEAYGQYRRLQIAFDLSKPNIYYEKLLADQTPGLSKGYQNGKLCYYFDVDRHPELKSKINPLHPENFQTFIKAYADADFFQTVLSNHNKYLLQEISKLRQERQQLDDKKEEKPAKIIQEEINKIEAVQKEVQCLIIKSEDGKENEVSKLIHPRKIDKINILQLDEQLIPEKKREILQKIRLQISKLTKDHTALSLAKVDHLERMYKALFLLDTSNEQEVQSFKEKYITNVLADKNHVLNQHRNTSSKLKSYIMETRSASRNLIIEINTFLGNTKHEPEVKNKFSESHFPLHR